MATYKSSEDQPNQDAYRFEHKFLIKSLIDNFSVTEIDYILKVILKEDQTLFELSDKYRRRIQNCRRDNKPCQINPMQFWIMLTISSIIWPELLFGKLGLCFSRVHDHGDYTFSNTILLPQGLNSHYARSREQYDKSPEHMLYTTSVTHLHRIIIWQQKAIFHNNGSLDLSNAVNEQIKLLLRNIDVDDGDNHYE